MEQWFVRKLGRKWCHYLTIPNYILVHFFKIFFYSGNTRIKFVLYITIDYSNGELTRPVFHEDPSYALHSHAEQKGDNFAQFVDKRNNES